MKKLFCVCCVSGLFANPSGEQWVAGKGRVDRKGTETRVIQSSDSAVIDWKDFSISPGETTHFDQPSLRSAILNRVVGGSISEIYGQLKSNGMIYLINENGIVVGPSGKIETKGGFAASTLSLASGENLEQELHFLKTKDSLIDFQGEISAPNAPVYLISSKIFENGKIDAGSIHLLAGSEVYISHPMGGMVKVAGMESHRSVDDFAIQQEGFVHASGYREVDGQIILWSENSVEVSGNLKASRVGVRGDSIHLKDGAQIDASALSGGGEIAIGGASRSVIVEKGALLLADAIDSGDGGSISVFGEKTIFHGAVSAQAFGISGNGGDVEISASDELTVGGQCDLRAKSGIFGTLVCDPGSVSIDNGAGVGPNNFGETFIMTQLGLGNLTISTFNGTNALAEQLTFTGGGSAANIMWAQPTTFTVIGRRNVIINTGVIVQATGSGSLSIEGQANASGNYAGVFINGATLGVQDGSLSILGTGGDTGAGNAGVAIDGASSISSTTGAIAITGTGGLAPGNQNFGIDVTSGSTILSTGGDIVLAAIAGGTGASTTNVGLTLDIGSQIGTDSGLLQLSGIGGAGLSSQGVNILTAGNVLSNVSGNIEIEGIGGPDSGVGVRIAGSATTNVTSSGSGDIRIVGTGGGGGDSQGVFLVALGATSVNVTANHGDIYIEGTATGPLANNDGIHLLNGGATGARVETTGTGTVSLVGTGSGIAGIGVSFDGTGNVVTTSNPAASISVTGTGNNENGIRLEPMSLIGGPGTTAPIALTADAMLLSGTVQGTSTLLVQPLNLGTSMGVGNLEPGTLSLSNAELANFLSFSSQMFGAFAGTGTVTAGGIALSRPTTLQSQTVAIDNPVNIGAFDLTALIGGSGTGLFNLQSTIASAGGTAQAVGAGTADRMTFNAALNTANTWNVDALNAGAFNSSAGFSFLFSNIGNLVGGNQDDAFVFMNQQGVSGFIDGGAPPFLNSLDYPGWNPPAIVQFLGPFDGLASNIDQGFFNIWQATGNFTDPPVPNIPATFSSQLSLSFLYLFLYGKDDDLFSMFQYYLLGKILDPKNSLWLQLFADVDYPVLPDGLNPMDRFRLLQEVPDPFVRPHFPSFID